MRSPINNLKKLLNKKRLDALLISNSHDITYLTGYSNFSSEEREAFLLITRNANVIITDGRYTEAVKKEIPDFTILERSAKTPLQTHFESVVKKYDLRITGFNEHDITVAEYNTLRKSFPKLIPQSLEELRVIKSDEEIIAIEKACNIGDKAFLFILKKLKDGITEKEIAFELENFIKKQNADLSFSSIVAFGENSAVPHHQTGMTRLKKNDFVLLDFGVKYHNYCSDMTRTVVFGKATEKQKKIHRTVLEAQQQAIDFLNTQYAMSDTRNNTVTATDVDNVARDFIIGERYPTIPHSLGHGIGIEVHEAPRLSPTSKETLQEGMVFSIEPGIYLPGFGGVRIEDLFVIQQNHLKQLTHASKNLIEI